MKQVALSLFTIVVVVAAVAGATTAVFSDQGSIDNNTVATGTLELTLNKSAGKPFSVTSAYPGYMSGWEHMDIFNGPYPPVAGQLPFEAYLTLTKTAGSNALWNELVIDLKTSGWNSDCTDGDAGEGAIYNGKVNAFAAQTLVSSDAYWHLANEDDGSPVGGPNDNIRPGYSERICQRVGVDIGAGNAVQGKSVTFSEVVDALQDND